MLWPTCCAACGAAGPSPCSACARSLRPAGPCPAVPGLDGCRALLAYEGAGRALVTGLKYRNDLAALGWLADRMAALLTPPAGAVVTWAPTTPARRRRRGYDQAELLAAAVARRWGVPCRRLLDRPPGRGGDAQTGASAVERRAGPALVARRAVRGPVVVVDDVTTTGATLRASARALRVAGAPVVVGLAAARTSRRVPAALPTVDEKLKSAARPAENRW